MEKVLNILCIIVGILYIAGFCCALFNKYLAIRLLLGGSVLMTLSILLVSLIIWKQYKEKQKTE